MPMLPGRGVSPQIISYYSPSWEGVRGWWTLIDLPCKVTLSILYSLLHLSFSVVPPDFQPPDSQARLSRSVDSLREYPTHF
jgi:hypothetical protein